MTEITTFHSRSVRFPQAMTSSLVNLLDAQVLPPRYSMRKDFGGLLAMRCDSGQPDHRF